MLGGVMLAHGFTIEQLVRPSLRANAADGVVSDLPPTHSRATASRPSHVVQRKHVRSAMPRLCHQCRAAIVELREALAEETIEERERPICELSHPRERRLVEDVMAAHPKLTATEAIEHLRWAEM
jgi:hypothetical protein